MCNVPAPLRVSYVGCKDDIQDIKKLLKSGNHDLRTEVIEKLLREHQLEVISPLYSIDEAEDALGYFQGVPLRETVTIGKDLTCTFYGAVNIVTQNSI